MNNWLRKLLRTREDGQALVETAVVLPLVLLVITGMSSFSIALYQKLLLAEAVGTAGRLLAVDRGNNNAAGVPDPCQDATNAIYNAAPGLVQSSLTITYNLNGTGLTNAGGGTYGTSCPGIALNQSFNAQVTASYSKCTLSAYGMSFGACNLQSKVTEVIQ